MAIVSRALMNPTRAKACGADGYRCERVDEIRPAIEAALNSPNAALVEAVVNANEKPTKPDELKV